MGLSARAGLGGRWMQWRGAWILGAVTCLACGCGNKKQNEGPKPSAGMQPAARVRPAPPPMAGRIVTDAGARTTAKQQDAAAARPAPVEALSPAELAKRLQGTWLIPAETWPPIPEIWSIRRKHARRIDSVNAKHAGAFTVLSPCRVAVAGKAYRMVRLGEQLLFTQRPVVVRHGADVVVACFDDETYVLRSGGCTRYEGSAWTGAGREARCELHKRGKHTEFVAKITAEVGGRKRVRTTRLRRLGPDLVHRKVRPLVAKKMDSLKAAQKEVAEASRRFLVPYGLWFGMKKKQLAMHLHKRGYGRAACPSEGTKPGKLLYTRPWDALPLPYLDLPVTAARCAYEDDKLSEVKLTLRTVYDAELGKALFDAVRQRLEGVTRAKPRKAKRADGVELTWKTPGVTITATRTATRATAIPVGDRVSLALTFTPTDKYKRPSRRRVWHHPRSRTRAYAWRRRGVARFRLSGLKLGTPKAVVLATLKRRGHPPKPAKAGGVWQGIIFRGTPAATGAKVQVYECALGARFLDKALARMAAQSLQSAKSAQPSPMLDVDPTLQLEPDADPTPSRKLDPAVEKLLQGRSAKPGQVAGYCSFTAGKLSQLHLRLFMTRSAYEWKLALQTVHERLVKKFGANPVLSLGAWKNGRQPLMIWKTRESLVVVKGLVEKGELLRDYLVVLVVTPLPGAS